VYVCENVVFATGGPGGLFKTSVYPVVHTGAIGVALLAGAMAQGLPECQFGMASTKFRWNVSGTYMQVLPRFISTSADGRDEKEFLREYFSSAGEMNSQVFLKGYQWPFDSRKAVGGSSLIDILVYIETVVKGRRVFLDFRRNSEGFDFESLSKEAHEYLLKSKALQKLPIERLRHMNPIAIELYKDHGIDICSEPLEIAVCAQHNNGGLSANAWWESSNVSHLFPVGEVNGSHGVYRPGGSALNSGQVGAFRAAEYIANRYRGTTVSDNDLQSAARQAVLKVVARIGLCRKGAGQSWKQERDEFQARMSRAGAHIRSESEIKKAVVEAWSQFARIEKNGCVCEKQDDVVEALKTRYLCFAHAVYLEAIKYAVTSGVGSRGSAVVLGQKGQAIHGKLGSEWTVLPEDTAFKRKVQETLCVESGKVENKWVDVRPIPTADSWFETTWSRFREGLIYDRR
jgi:succinate dehydrogenase/fumarate reductase flavoprotein subunit